MKLTTVTIGALALVFAAPIGCSSHSIRELEKKRDRAEFRLMELNKEIGYKKQKIALEAGIGERGLAPEKMRTIVIGEDGRASNRNIGVVANRLGSGEPKVMRIAVRRGPDGMQPGMNPQQMPQKFLQMPGQAVPQGFRPMSGMPMNQMPQGFMRPQERGGWFMNLPEPMRENAMLWIFYILTHKPPMEGMPPKPEFKQPPKAGAPAPATNAAGVPNEMMERVKGAIAERDQKIERLTRALEEAKAQGGNPGEMEQRFKAQMEEKDNVIKKQKERIAEMEKAIQDLKTKVEALRKQQSNG